MSYPKQWQGLYARIVTARKTSLLNEAAARDRRRAPAGAQQKAHTATGAMCAFGKGTHRLPESVERVYGTVCEGNHGLTQVLVTLHLAGSGGKEFFRCFPFLGVTGYANAKT